MGKGKDKKTLGFFDERQIRKSEYSIICRFRFTERMRVKEVENERRNAVEA